MSCSWRPVQKKEIIYIYIYIYRERERERENPDVPGIGRAIPLPSRPQGKIESGKKEEGRIRTTSIFPTTAIGGGVRVSCCRSQTAYPIIHVTAGPPFALSSHGCDLWPAFCKVKSPLSAQKAGRCIWQLRA